MARYSWRWRMGDRGVSALTASRSFWVEGDGLLRRLKRHAALGLPASLSGRTRAHGLRVDGRGYGTAVEGGDVARQLVAQGEHGVNFFDALVLAGGLFEIEIVLARSRSAVAEPTSE